MQTILLAAGMKFDRSVHVTKQHTTDRRTDDRQSVSQHREVLKTHEDRISRTQNRDDRGRADQTISRTKHQDPRRRNEQTHDTRRRNEHLVTEAPRREPGKTYKGTVFDTDFRNTGNRYDDSRRYDNTVSRNNQRYSGRQYDERYYESLYRDLLRRYEQYLANKNRETRLPYGETVYRDKYTHSDRQHKHNDSVKVGHNEKIFENQESHTDLRKSCADIDSGTATKGTRCICSSSMSITRTVSAVKLSILSFIIIVMI